VIVTAGFDYFFVTGLLSVAFALIISLFGLMHSKFPGKSMGLLMVLSVCLFIAGIVGAAVGSKYKAGERHGAPKGSESVAGHKGS
jgi:hypothetical protein